MAWIVADPELLAEHERGDLGAQFLARVAFRPEGMCQVAVQPRRVAGPAAELMQRRRKIAVLGRKLPALR